ncbi:MAG: Mitochondrial distribution and morphology protein 12 [Geoglossum simile]|nr:MAG: Mitochondrial distribution and morphology protein 12 [Geoglossum simile]
MSIDISWPTLTSGPDGDRFAAQIRDFVHDKFQKIALPRFVQSVQVHSFEFGTIAPDVELKDIGDPLGRFYEGHDGSDGGEEDGEGEVEEDGWMRRRQGDDEEEDEDIYVSSSHTTLRATWHADNLARPTAAASADTSTPIAISTLPHPPPAYHDSFRSPHIRTTAATSTEPVPFYPPPLPYRSPAPMAPGGTSTLNHYFHSPLISGLSGTQTPLAAVAGAHLSSGWQDHASGSLDEGDVGAQRQNSTESVESLSPPSTADSSMSTSTPPGETMASHPASPPLHPSPPATQPQLHSRHRRRIPRPSDFQVITRVRYAGNIALSLTAMILLDYPMSSFVGIPIKLNITGLSFDGVAVLAFTRQKNVHFCFLAHEDAAAMVGGDDIGAGGGGLLKEIKVESEIGQREGGKQSLKNVGKVEKFVLEQVRKIFEEEFVYPSFWTFLV